MPKRNAVTTKDLESWGYQENPDGTWSKPSAKAPMGGVGGKVDSQQARTLDGEAPSKRSSQNGRKNGDQTAGRRQTPTKPRKRHTGPPSAPRWVVTMVAHVRTYLDDDNLANAMKPVQDELADHLGTDDGSGLIRWQRGQVETRGAEGVAVSIEEVGS